MKFMKKQLVAGILAIASAFALGACSNNEGSGLRLENGDEPFVTTDFETITNQDAFQFMLGNGGVSSLTDLVDTQILQGQFSIDHDAIEESMSGFREMAEAGGEEWENFLLARGFDSEASFTLFMELDELRRQAGRAAITVTDEEIQQLFDNRFPEPVEGEEDEDADAEPRPELSDVRDELEEQLIQSRLTAGFVNGELARLRHEAGLVILDPYLRGLYENFLGAVGAAPELFPPTNETSTTVAARIGDVEITADDLFNEMIPAIGLSAAVTLADPAILREKFDVPRQEVTDLMNQSKIQLGEQFYTTMASQGLNNDEEIFNHLELILLQEAAFHDRYAPTEERLRELYDEFQPNISARHILVETEEEAQSLIDQLKEADNVEETFMELAAEHSLDGSSANGGDLGSFGTGVMVAPFEEAAFALNVGEFTTEPVETQFGFHVIYKYAVDERPAFEDMKEQLRSTELSNLYSAQRLEALLIDLREAAGFKLANARMQERYELIVANMRDFLANNE